MRALPRLLIGTALIVPPLVSLASPGAATTTGHATKSATSTVVTGYTSDVTLCVDGTCTTQNFAGTATLTALSMSATPNSVPPPGDSYESVKCNQAYSWSDANGTFHYQHACGATISGWGFQISKPLQQIIVESTVDEQGLDWWRNGLQQPRQAHHYNYPKNYYFHGSFNPFKKGDGVAYSDKYSFDCNLGDNCHGSISVHGAIRQL